MNNIKNEIYYKALTNMTVELRRRVHRQLVESLYITLQTRARSYELLTIMEI